MNLAKYREDLKETRRLVVKIGTSSLSYSNGRLNFSRIEKFAYVLSTIRKKGIEVILVSSGAIGIGAGRLGMLEKPVGLAQKQALAAIGQAELIKIYQKFFGNHGQVVAQVLLTKDVVTLPSRHQNARGTLNRLLEMDIIPIINENDTISTYEIEFGDNDTLSAIVAELLDAELLVMLSDIDGLYSADPKIESGATIIPAVSEITPEIEKLANGAGSVFSTGGMKTKLAAARICSKAGIDMVIANGSTPDVIFEILKGKDVGTHFIPSKINMINKI